MCSNLKLSFLLILSPVLLGPIRTHPMVGVTGSPSSKKVRIGSPSSKKVQEGNDQENAQQKEIQILNIAAGKN